MAIYHLSARDPIARSAGRSTTAAAAYRASECITDARTGEVFDFTRKAAPTSKKILLPGGQQFTDRASFWNGVELHHKRNDAVLAREIIVALPIEIDEAKRAALAEQFAQNLADKFGVAADVCIHPPARKKGKKDGDELNHHAHILLSACSVDAAGALSKKAVLLDPIHCQRHKIEDSVAWARPRWAGLVNEYLERANSAERVSHLSNVARDIDDVPTIHVGNDQTAPSRRAYNKKIREENNAHAIQMRVLLTERAREKVLEIKRDVQEKKDIAALRERMSARSAAARTTNPAELRVAAQQTPASATQMPKIGEKEMNKDSLKMILQQAVNTSKNADHLQKLLNEKGIKTEFFREADNSKIAALKIKNDEKWIDSKDIDSDFSWQKIVARWQAAASGGTSNIDIVRPALAAKPAIIKQARASDQLKSELDIIANGLYASSMWLAALVIALINAILAAIQKTSGIEMPRIDMPIPQSNKPIKPIVQHSSTSKFVAGEEKTETACATVLDSVRQIRESIIQDKPLPKPNFKDEDINTKIVALQNGMKTNQSDIDDSESNREREYKNLQHELQYAKNLITDYQRDLKSAKEKDARESYENSIKLLNKRIEDLLFEIAYVESDDYEDLDKEGYYETPRG